MPVNAEQLKNISVKDCDKSMLTDILSVKIDGSKSKSEKLLDYVAQIKNPYLFKLGDLAVKVTFQQKGESLQEKIESLVLANLGS